MDFDFNLILVPLTLGLFGLWLLDKLVLHTRRRAQHSSVQLMQADQRVQQARQQLLETETGLKQAQGYQFDRSQPAWLAAQQQVQQAQQQQAALQASAATQREPALIRWAYEFWPVLMLVLVVRAFLAEPFNIPSESMAPGLKTGDFILVNKYAFGVRLPLLNYKILDTGSPQRGDVAVFRYPPDPRINYIKRVIGLPGDTVHYDRGTLSVNGQPLPRQQVTQPDMGAFETRYQEQSGQHRYTISEVNGENVAARAPFLQQVSPEAQTSQGRQWSVTVPAGHYFVMGDNRDNSADSRFWGFVADSHLSGRAFYVWMHKKPGLQLPTFDRNRAID